MKIKACKVKPGMIIIRAYNLGKKTKRSIYDYELVTFKKGGVEVEYGHFNGDDSYSGQMIGFMKGNEIVKVVTNKKKRAKILKGMLEGVFKRLHDSEDDVNLIRLIQAMEK